MSAASGINAGLLGMSLKIGKNCTFYIIENKKCGKWYLLKHNSVSNQFLTAKLIQFLVPPEGVSSRRNIGGWSKN